MMVEPATRAGRRYSRTRQPPARESFMHPFRRDTICLEASETVRCQPDVPQAKGRTMMLDWNEYQKQLLTTIGDIGRLNPDTLRGYRALSDAGAKTNLLGAKTRELIALAVAVTRQCDGCITIHTDAAAKHGATREEIVEALGVAIAVNAGATLVYSARVIDAFAAKVPADK